MRQVKHSKVIQTVIAFWYEIYFGFLSEEA